MEETNMNVTVYKQVTRGQPGIRTGTGRSSIRAGAGRTFIRGGSGRSSTRGGSGRSSTRGGSGRSSTRGGSGRSSTRGGSGRSSIRGSSGQERIRAGAGRSSICGDNDIPGAMDDGVDQSSIHGENDGDRAATHVGNGQPSFRGGAGQSTTNNGNGGGRTTIHSDIGQQVIIEKNVRGTVITVQPLKHYYFIKRQDQLQFRDIFVRNVSIINEPPNLKKLFLHDKCMFDLIQTPKGFEAINVKIVERHINSVSKLPKIPKRQDKENEQTQISKEFFKETIAELFRQAMNNNNK